jgi:hypothetical protein
MQKSKRPNQRDKVGELDRLARQINAEFKKGESARHKADKHFIATGRLLLKVKAKLGHGHWERWVEQNVQFSKSKAVALMKIASHPVLGNPQHAALLPPCWSTRAMLATLPPETVDAMAGDGFFHPELGRTVLHPDLQRKDVKEIKRIVEPAERRPARSETDLNHFTKALKVGVSCMAGWPGNTDVVVALVRGVGLPEVEQFARWLLVEVVAECKRAAAEDKTWREQHEAEERDAAALL